MITPHDITGLILAGGRGSRMGGVDKGLQPYKGQTLAHNALQRLGPQVGPLLLNANRNLMDYAALGVTVCTDTVPDYPGPLAGFLSGLQQCQTPYLLTVPCDSPRFPLDLAARLSAALEREQADIAMASGWEAVDDASPREHALRAQPVFCLLRVSLLPNLTAFVQSGRRKIDAWTGQHSTVLVPFDQPSDDPLAFANANTLSELQQLENR
jgi:molybdopterin-guanine dinucleotide biosynthesis protein A